MRFATTHPLVTHPYHPDLVTGAGIAAVATAAEAAGFHGFGFTDHPAPSQRWLDGGGHDALDPVRRPRLRRGPHHDPSAHPEHRRAAVPEPVRGGQGGRHPRRAVRRALHPRPSAPATSRASSRRSASTTRSATSSSTRRSTCSIAVWTGDDVTFEGRHFNARGVTAHPAAGERARIHRSGSAATAAGPGSAWPTAATAGARSRPPAVLAEHGPHDRAGHARAAGRGDRRPPRPPGARPAEIRPPSTSPSPTPPAAIPPSDAFDADAHLEGLAELAALGVTWVQVAPARRLARPRHRDRPALRPRRHRPHVTSCFCGRSAPHSGGQRPQKLGREHDRASWDTKHASRPSSLGSPRRCASTSRHGTANRRSA